MATYQITPPKTFDFSKPEEWPKWIRRFERFCQASALTEQADEGQVNTLIYTMGDEANDILRSFGLSAADQKKYDTVRDRFEAHFVKRRNTIFERAKFNHRKQEDGESVDAFITSLYGLAEHCGYRALHDEMIRDRIVVGLRDATLSEKLQIDPELTLDRAVRAVRQTETVRKQQAVVRGEDEHSKVDTVRARHTPKGRPGGTKRFPPQNQKQTPPTQNAKSCSRCGKSPPHGCHQCPARDATCHKCRKKGHFQSVCKSAKLTVGAVQADESDAFLGTVQAETDSGNDTWTVTVSFNGSSVEFKIDTGADVSVIPEATFDKLEGITLTSSTRSLKGPSQYPLHVHGRFIATLRYGTEKSEEEIFVVRGLQQALMGCEAIIALCLVSRINAIEDEGEKFMSRCPEVFQGLGPLQGEYHIKLKGEAKPFALTTPRRDALPLLPKVKAELQRMEQLGVITRVDEPTDWCSGMVVVPKPNGKVRICVDLTRLNESVCRECLILPSVEHILAQLAEAKVFTKLDANSGFWQIKLSKDSALLTTFMTPCGRFCFNRLPFGITSAPEYFQKQKSDILAGLEGVVCMIDDAFSGSGLTPVPSTTCPRNLTLFLENWHFSGFRVTPACLILSRTAMTHWSCSSRVRPCTST